MKDLKRFDRFDFPLRAVELNLLPQSGIPKLIYRTHLLIILRHPVRHSKGRQTAWHPIHQQHLHWLEFVRNLQVSAVALSARRARLAVYN